MGCPLICPFSHPQILLGTWKCQWGLIPDTQIIEPITQLCGRLSFVIGVRWREEFGTGLCRITCWKDVKPEWITKKKKPHMNNCFFPCRAPISLPKVMKQVHDWHRQTCIPRYLLAELHLILPLAEKASALLLFMSLIHFLLNQPNLLCS